MSNLPPPPPPGGGFPPPPGGGFPPPPPPGGGFPPPPGDGYPPPGGPPGGGFPPPGGPPGGGFPPPGGAYPPAGGPGQLAEWQDRAVSGLIDYAGPWIVGYLLSTIGGGFSFGVASDAGGLYYLGSLIQLLTIPWALYNGYLAGSTGQSIGMKQSGLRMVGEQTGQVIGGNQGLVRNLILIPGFCCCGLLLLIDGLFPLWDAKKQTLRDKIAKSVVLKG